MFSFSDLKSIILLLNFLHLWVSSVEGFKSTDLQRSHKLDVTVKTNIQTLIRGTENAVRKLEPNQQEPIRYLAVKNILKCFKIRKSNTLQTSVFSN
jgi:hypothetical protein